MYTSVSDDFLSAVNGAEPVYCCKLDFGNNVTVNDLFTVSYSGGSCSAGIAPGGTVIANAKVELSALPVTVKKGSTCTLYFGVNGEYAPQGVLTVKKIEKNNGRLTVTLEDNMAKTEKGYFSSLTYPSTTLKMLSEIAAKCGITFSTSGLTAVTVKEKPEGYTCREIIGYIAGLYGKFAVCDRTGKIIFKWFDTTVQLSENCFDTPTVAADDITVGRVVCGDFTAGTGTAITYDCLFMTQNQLNTVQKGLNGFKYRTGEIPLMLGNMLIDAWDIVSVTYDGETVNIPAANFSMTYNGGLSMIIEAPAEEKSADSSESYKSPAQKQAERITADIVSAKQALLEKADITELNAQIANLESVYAAKADITELSAQIATIDNLTAKKADVEQLYAKKANIDELVANTGTITSLKSDVANIDVLLSGKAGTGELTSIKLTAENAEIATALIKDLTAANFRSKTIETDDFTIKSSSGKLQIVNNTIQIKDKNNTVRVQIGEDGKSDYGIYVIDASGNIMFTSYDGLHEDGIKSGIIKNDMVADDAHISGSKLDISSVIDGINADNSTYLNTSKVVIDGTSQTINAKFTELTASIGSIGTRTSALESDLSGFRTTVSETYATKSTVDNIQIGGRNIVTGTADAVIGYGGHSKGHWRKYSTAGTIQTVDITDTPISCVSKGIRLTSTDENSQIICGQDDIPLNSGVIYTFSCRIRSNSAEGVPCRLQPFYKSTTDHSGNTQDIIISDEWRYISFTAKFSPQNTGIYSGARIYLQPTAAGNYIEVCGIKLEKGNKATDWSPAPEDTAADITALSSQQSTLEQTVDGFKATVESTYATKSSLTGYPTLTQMNSAIDQKADSVTTTVTEQIAGITVGSTNIATGSATLTIGTGGRSKGEWRAAGNGALAIAIVSGDVLPQNIKNAAVCTVTSANVTAGIAQNDEPMDSNSYYTLSCWAKATGNYTIKCRLVPFFTGGTDYGDYDVTNTWTRISYTSKNKPKDTTSRATVVYAISDTVGRSIMVCGIKLEKGNKPTDWSPAPEDTAADITVLSSKQSTLEQTVNGFKATVESTYATNTKVSEVEQKADKISWLVKSGTSASNMVLTDRALKIVTDHISLNADVKVNGSMIVEGSIKADRLNVTSLAAISANLGTVTSGTIKSNNYLANKSGSMLSLSMGTWTSNSATGKITIKPGAIVLEKLSNGAVTGDCTEIIPENGAVVISNPTGSWYLKATSASSTALSKNNHCYVMFNKNGMITANGSYTNSRDTDGNIVRLVALTTANHFHVGSPDISGITRLICGNCNTIEFCRPQDSGTVTSMAKMIYDTDNVRTIFKMPLHFSLGTSDETPCIRQMTKDGAQYLIKVGNLTHDMQILGSSVTSNKTISVSSDARVKNHISALPSGSENLFDYLSGKSFFYNGDTSTARNYGFIAQDVLSALQKCGLSTNDFAGFCDINGDGSHYALAYEQFIPIMWDEIKKLRKALSERS